MENDILEFYKLCKNMKLDDYYKILDSDASKEEKDFVAAILNYFISQEQMKIINK